MPALISTSVSLATPTTTNGLTASTYRAPVSTALQTTGSVSDPWSPHSGVSYVFRRDNEIPQSYGWSPGPGKSLHEGPGSMIALSLQDLERIHPGGAQPAIQAIRRASNGGTFKGLTKAYQELDRLTKPISGLPEWGTEQQEDLSYRLQTSRADFWRPQGPDWLGLRQVGICGMTVSAITDVDSTTFDAIVRAGDQDTDVLADDNTIAPPTEVQESKSNHLAVPGGRFVSEAFGYLKSLRSRN